MSEHEKRELEHQAARLFLRRYEKQHGVEMRHIWHNEPRQPDVTCYLGEQKLDLEIAHLYGSEEEAMHLLGRDLSQETRIALQHLQNISPDHRILEALNRILINKAEKFYHSDVVWLVIRNVNPHWTLDDFEQRIHLIHQPQSHPFDQIWLIGDLEARSGILRLD